MIGQYINWKSALVLIAVCIAATSLYFANNLTEKLAVEERNKVIFISQALETVGKSTEGDIILATSIIEKNTTIPLIQTDANDSILTYNNIDSAMANSNQLQEILSELRSLHKPIQINVSETEKQNIYYGESELLKQLRYFPYILLIILFLFVIIVVSFINATGRQIQDRVWVGMSKETAHQLGTPLTSLIAWIEYLKSSNVETKALEEMEKDVDRLQLIADRFSKIGSVPKLHEENLMTHLDGIIGYMQKRASKNVKIETQSNKEEIIVLISGALFDWVIENLIRNSLDAMDGKGKISFKVTDEITQTIIDVTDSGKGIAKNNIKKVFKPGFSTKLRGWGLGLSLSKRIIKEYHHGDIFVKKSELGKGTTFRIILKR
ncbi:MAG TPA: HAMP domain-containing sensor histidine kinase [Chitinophagaceae bacterium]|nr:HAMP domain-containing sensor histidine kinase [Chitinophagaceae bacterium]